MSKQQNQSRALTRDERSYLSALASEFPFWRDVAERAKSWNGTLTAGQYDRLCEAIAKYPNVLNGKPIRNRQGKDGSIHCWRSKDGCKSVAVHVVDHVGVCSTHIETQQRDAERYAASRPRKPKPDRIAAPATPPNPEEERRRTNEALKTLASLLDPLDESATA